MSERDRTPPLIDTIRVRVMAFSPRVRIAQFKSPDVITKVRSQHQSERSVSEESLPLLEQIMTIRSTLRDHALQLLRLSVDDTANFREGQWEAIEALVTRRARLLVVQRTGWGKSVVYFLTTKLLREQGAGPTLLVSPLLALMRNQVAAAERIGIRAVTINSTNPADWPEIEARLSANEVDVLLISPERFANEGFQRDVLLTLAQGTGLFVVDEAHCISDWGHDFRPDYRRIVQVLQRLPPGIPICATTATANDRVVRDVVEQLGSNLEVVRGPLIRESLRLQTVPLHDDAAKLAWLATHISNFPGSGIIYALTIRWTNRIALWLQERGIGALEYHSDLSNEERQDREQRLLNNEVKALVATTALGMGFDKPDLGFVVHFHQPASVVLYYQQVGRAGRSISEAFGVMLAGGDDDDINDFFISQAFPAEEEVSAVLEVLEQTDVGLSVPDLQKAVNLPQGQIEKVLKTLAVQDDPPIAKLENRWVSTPHRYDPKRRAQLFLHLTQVRQVEKAQMDAYLHHNGCLMEFLARCLDDPSSRPCGRCATCCGRRDAFRAFNETFVRDAIAFLRRSDIPIQPRKRWQQGAFPVFGWQGNIAQAVQAQEGRALCILRDSGWGGLVRRGLYENGRFTDELVEAVALLVQNWKPTPPPTWMTCVPSLTKPDLLPDFATRLAARLGIPFAKVVRKIRDTSQQKQMQNSWQQAHNLDGAFDISYREGIGGPVLLLDDVVDSGWTYTIISALLRQAGSGPVFPLSLAAVR